MRSVHRTEQLCQLLICQTQTASLIRLVSTHPASYFPKHNLVTVPYNTPLSFWPCTHRRKNIHPKEHVLIRKNRERLPVRPPPPQALLLRSKVVQQAVEGFRKGPRSGVADKEVGPTLRHGCSVLRIRGAKQQDSTGTLVECCIGLYEVIDQLLCRKAALPQPELVRKALQPGERHGDLQCNPGVSVKGSGKRYIISQYNESNKPLHSFPTLEGRCSSSINDVLLSVATGKMTRSTEISPHVSPLYIF